MHYNSHKALTVLLEFFSIPLGTIIALVEGLELWMRVGGGLAAFTAAIAAAYRTIQEIRTKRKSRELIQLQIDIANQQLYREMQLNKNLDNERKLDNDNTREGLSA